MSVLQLMTLHCKLSKCQFFFLGGGGKYKILFIGYVRGSAGNSEGVGKNVKIQKGGGGG